MNSDEIIRGVKDLYSRFPVPKNFHEHLFRVVAIGTLIAYH